MRWLTPDLTVAAVPQIDPKKLWQEGRRGIILDIDNTITPWQADEPLPEVVEWVARAKQLGFRICLVSNAPARRVRHFARRLGVDHVLGGRKPGRRPFVAAGKLLGLSSEQVVVVGDQLFTDVVGGKRMGFYTILVDPISSREFCATRLSRRLEAVILKQMAHRGLLPQEEVDRRLLALFRPRAG
ncbi:MAG: YqeG family HAD IIIA-type phosphatase [Limnochordales bacterium]|nr:YqeG family HAD IIIA-type phosphatase [Limnochordales bacterium]